MTKICTNCGQSLSCTPKSIETCWCSSFPPLLPPEDATGCLCPSCLKAQVIPRVEEIVQEIKSGKRENDAIRYAGNPKQLIKDIDYYLENNCWVLTDWYHLKRGYCCGNNCRHCPYDHVNVKK